MAELHHPGLPHVVAARKSSATYAAWLKWNGKEVLTTMLGAGYPQLAGDREP